MRLRARPELRVAALAVIALACALTIRGASSRQPAAAVAPPSERGLVGDIRPAVSVGSRMIVVLRSPSVAQRLAAGQLPTEQQERSWSAEDYAAQQQVLTELDRHGLGVRPDYSYVRVIDGFSARLDPRAVALLEADPEIAGVYPVVVAYPATLSASALSAAEPELGTGVSLPGFDGAGVTIALLDTGVDAAAPYLSGRVAPGIDVVGGSPSAKAAADPASPHALEAHGTELAGLLVGSGGPGGIEGVAPGASLLPIRVAGWQPDGHGGEALYARSDELIAGLERTVDPSGEGDVQGAVRVALIGLAEPFDGFPDSPEAQAVGGALRLGVLVVAPAGNDGLAGPWFGSIAGPGGAPAALTVGALDSRPETSSERLVVAQGLDVLDDGLAPLLAGGSVRQRLELPLASAVAGTPLRGAAALVESGADPVSAVAHAIAAGARAVLLAGEAPASGSLGSLGVPVLWVSGALARNATTLLAQGAALEVGIGGLRGEPNPGFGSLAVFSSSGLSFAGLVDPELSAPGIDIATSEPGPDSYATVSGTSAAAAAVAGAAALLAQARPALSAGELGSLLAGSARPGGFPLASGGVGALDVGASAAAEVAASVTSLGFGAWSGPHWHAQRPLTVWNVSTRPLRVGFDPGSALVRVVPATLTLPPGGHGTVLVAAAATRSAAAAVVTGILEVVPFGGRALRLPWSIAFRPPLAPLVRALGIAPSSFAPSGSGSALLRLSVGALPGGARLEVEPAARLEIRLYAQNGRYLGLLARIGDVVPGRYAFAITGRGPGGALLAPGSYSLALLAWPLLGGAPTRARIGFRIE